MAAPEDIPRPKERAAPQRPRGGHHAKIHEAVTALRAAGRLPTHLRTGHRDQLIIQWLEEAGYGSDLPDRNAIRRYCLWEQQRERNDATRSMTPPADAA
jgi:hypothetical protein